jgi:hypothetical protein
MTTAPPAAGLVQNLLTDRTIALPMSASCRPCPGVNCVVESTRTRIAEDRGSQQWSFDYKLSKSGAVMSPN